MSVKILSTLVAAAAMVGGSLTSVQPATAADGRNAALFGGLAAGAVLGGVIAGGARGYAPRPVYGGYPAYDGEEVYEAPVVAPRCFIDRQPAYNSWGDFVGYRRVRVCD